MTEAGAAPLVAAVCMAALHLGAARLRFLGGVPRSRWLSVAGGISVAYIVVHLLPELAEYQELTAESAAFGVALVERHIYVFALAGLAVFYGVELWARTSRGRDSDGEPSDAATAFGITTYAVYNAVIGYLLVGRREGVGLFAFALGLHFVVNDHGLREHHGAAYHRYGRWLLAAAVLAGTATGYLTRVSEVVIGLLIAFIGGGTILNVLKEELPEERESRFGAFAAGAAAYTVVLLAL